MAKAVMTAPDPVVQIKTAADFVKKYPKSTLRLAWPGVGAKN
jgi:hypothetical protein